MEAFLAQVATAARKASDQGDSKQGRPPVQQKSAAAGRPVKKEGVRQRSPSAPARNRARNSHQEPNTHKHKTLDWQAAPNSAIPATINFMWGHHVKEQVLPGAASPAYPKVTA